jgi:multiple sugar transport system substrate-binding protein
LVTLRAIGWDDPRCIDPLRAALDEWCGLHNLDYEIGTRPLTAFNDQPLEELARECDVMSIDHPHVAAAVAAGVLAPLDRHVPAEELAAIRADALGSNFDCYVVGATPYALHADAACQLGAVRQSLLGGLGETWPQSMADAIGLAQRHPGAVVWPLYHTDAVSSLLSLLAADEAGPLVEGPFCRDRAKGVAAIEAMTELAGLMDPACWEFTPQKAFAFAAERPVAYLPFLFCYMRFASADTPHGPWTMGRSPAGRGSVLGGAGLAVSAASPIVAAASRFVAWYCLPGTLRRLVASGAQPGSVTAWSADDPDPVAAGFFGAVRPILQTAWVRPQATWWPQAQIAAGHALVEGLRARRPSATILDSVEAAYAAARSVL